MLISSSLIVKLYSLPFISLIKKLSPNNLKSFKSLTAFKVIVAVPLLEPVFWGLKPIAKEAPPTKSYSVLCDQV